MRADKTFNLAGIIPFSSVAGEAGFVLPVFETSGSSHFFVQVPDVRSAKAEDFAGLAESADLKIHTDVPQVTTKRGADLVFAFQYQDQISAGPIGKIREVLRNYSKENPDDTATLLQIAELSDDAGVDSQDVRRRMINQVADSFGLPASRNFAEVSLFLDGLWSALVRRADDEKLETLISARRTLLLDADAKRTNIFSTSWQKWLKSEIGIDINELRSDIAAVRRLYNKKEQQFAFEELISREFSAVKSEPRQEGRIARIIQRAIENPDVGVAVMSRYRDTATFANRALDLLQSNAENLRWSPEGAFAHWLIDALYSMAYPRQRGILLYELADHLGKYPSFADAIMRRTHGSNAEAVVFAREAIQERILNPQAPKPAIPPRPGYAYPSGSYRFQYVLPQRD